MNTEREQLKSHYPALFSTISELLFEADPIGINFGSNTDEYEPEVGTVLPRLYTAESVQDAHTIVYEEFLRWFDEDTAGPKEAYASVSARIWEAWRAFNK